MDTSRGLTDLEPLSAAENLTLLGRGRIGRIGFRAGGVPQVLPVNYAVDDQGTVVFRTTCHSVLLAAAGQQVAFEVDGFDAELHSGWSVCVIGQAREISDDQDPTARRLRQLSVVTWAPGPRECWIAVTPESITGRRLPLAATAADFGWIPGIVG